MATGYFLALACLLATAQAGRLRDNFNAFFRCEGQDLVQNGQSLEVICRTALNFKIQDNAMSAYGDFTAKLVMMEGNAVGNCDDISSLDTATQAPFLAYQVAAADLLFRGGEWELADDFDRNSAIAINDVECETTCLTAWIQFAGDSDADAHLVDVKPMVTDCSRVTTPGSLDIALEITTTGNPTLTVHEHPGVEEEEPFFGFYLSEVLERITVRMNTGDQLASSEEWPTAVTAFLRREDINSMLNDQMGEEFTCSRKGFGSVTKYDDPIRFWTNDETMHQGDEWQFTVTDNEEMTAMGNVSVMEGHIARCPVCGMAYLYVVFDTWTETMDAETDYCNNYEVIGINIDCNDKWDRLGETLVVSPNPSNPLESMLVRTCSPYEWPELYEYKPQIGRYFTQVHPSFGDYMDITGWERVRFAAARLAMTNPMIGGAELNQCEPELMFDLPYDGKYNGVSWASNQWIYHHEDMTQYAFDPATISGFFNADDAIDGAMIDACAAWARQDDAVWAATEDYLQEGCREMLTAILVDKKCPKKSPLYRGECSVKRGIEEFIGAAPTDAHMNEYYCMDAHREDAIDVQSCGNRLATMALKHNKNIALRVLQDLRKMEDFHGNTENLKQCVGDFLKNFMDVGSALDYMDYCPLPDFINIDNHVGFYATAVGGNLYLGTPDFNNGTTNCWREAALFSCHDC